MTVHRQEHAGLAEMSALKRAAREERDRRIREYHAKFPDAPLSEIAIRFRVENGVVKRLLGIKGKNGERRWL